jgi:integrase
MARKTDYLFLRPDSRNWHIRFQGTPRIERSLGTPDRVQAEILALPMIADHKAKVLARRPRLDTVWTYELEPGRTHPGPDGGTIVATEDKLIHLNHNGAVIKTTANGRQALQFSGFTGHPLTVQNMTRDLREAFEPRPTVATKNGDDDYALFETYLRERNVTGFKEGEARAMWSLFRELCPGVKLKDATRDDGRKLVAHLTAKGNKSRTIEKKIMWLRAAVNFAIAEGKLRFNPFAAIVRNKGKDATKRRPFKDDDLKVIRANLDKLPEADRLLIRILATTGMRLGEAYQINGEAKERGVRYVEVGSKTEQSERRVPLPAKLLPHLPKIIKGRLFPASDNEHLASSRLNPWLRDIGITDKAKVIHSFRHRAQDRLRAAGCREDVRWGILGHEKKTLAEGYGEGFPVPFLKKWIDRIGF